MREKTRAARRGGAISKRGGVPTTVRFDDPDAAHPVQLSLPVASTAPTRSRHSILPGVVHISGWLDVAAQQHLVNDFRRWALPPAGLRHPRVPTGNLMSVQSVCLGWHWQPYLYTRTAVDTDGAPVKPLPDDLASLARGAVGDTYGRCSSAARMFAPDAAIVNLYGPGAKLGLHQDGEEPSAAPVVTISLGDTCTFRLAGVDRRTGPFTDLELRSGDLVVFGGPSRRIFHGVPKVFPNTGPDDIGLPYGRLSITIRETGLSEPALPPTATSRTAPA